MDEGIPTPQVLTQSNSAGNTWHQRVYALQASMDNLARDAAGHESRFQSKSKTAGSTGAAHGAVGPVRPFAAAASLRHALFVARLLEDEALQLDWRASTIGAVSNNLFAPSGTSQDHGSDRFASSIGQATAWMLHQKGMGDTPDLNDRSINSSTQQAGAPYRVFFPSQP